MSNRIVWIAMCLRFVADTRGQIDLGHCRNPLGMADKRLTDEQLSASSSHAPGTGPQYARLNREEGDGAWCPRGLVRPDTSEHWLQIRLSSPSFLSVVHTQGRHGGGRGSEFTPMYKLNYSRDGLLWRQWKNYSGNSVLHGNMDAQKVQPGLLSPGISAASFIRFIPVTSSARSVCARLELFGCPMSSNLVRYDIPIPDNEVLSSNWRFDDETYDGIKGENSYQGGLGQLSDGVVGLADVRKVRSNLATRINGFDYVGWRNSEEGDREVNITFEFGDTRNFTEMKVHCVASHEIGASYFQSVHLSFSTDGEDFRDSPRAAERQFHADPAREGARVFSLPLNNAIARYVRAKFLIRDEWLLISEVEFVDATASKDWESVFRRRPSRVATIPTITAQEIGHVGVIACALVGAVLFLAFIVAVLAWRQRKMKKIMTPPRYTYTVREGPSSTVTLRLADERSFSDNRTPKAAPFLNNSERRLISTPHEYADPKDAKMTSCNDDDISPIAHYAETSISSLPPPYQMPTSNSASKRTELPKYSQTLSESSTLLMDESRDRFCEFVNSYDRGMCRELLEHCSECGVIEFPRQRLRFVDHLGEGQFGQVQLCKADPVLRVHAQQWGTNLDGDDGDPVLVAVKYLRGDASPDTRESFLKEAKIMSGMRDPNIVRLLAVCVEAEPYALVTEYMSNGDLNGYLQRFEFDSPDCDAIISVSILLGIATQISAGMKYLSSLNFVHRDLATRNCLVGARLNVRISDFGMSRDMYQSDYYKTEGRAVLPIRWMPWESVLMGKFSTASDVWAFGVTVWEIFTLCRAQPFQDLSDSDIIDNMNRFYDATGDEMYLTKPPFCPENVFQVMMDCWSRDVEERPKFDQLYDFFKLQV